MGWSERSERSENERMEGEEMRDDQRWDTEDDSGQLSPIIYYLAFGPHIPGYFDAFFG